jgi:hypothetical protein
MQTFLHYVAQDIIRKYEDQLSHITVVFPNKRASLFLNQELAVQVDHPLWSPTCITISDLFRKHSQRTVGDPIKLVSELYKVYHKVTGEQESLDKFYGWGQLLITDFDDIDKNMADADQIFTNLKDIHELDDVSYLSDEQKKILKQFFSNFSEDQESVLKKRFITLWSHFADIYHQFNQSLKDQKLAYEGALYREVATDPDLKWKHSKYLFVGFNMMQKVELALCDRLKKDDKAKFYWDFDDYYMPKKDQDHEAGHYIAQYLKNYPNELDNENDEIYKNMVTPKSVTFISASTENLQARYVSDWLKENHRIEAGRRTAIVMADESLLPTIIHSLPPEVTKVNVTTGYPLSQSPVSTLVTLLVDLHTHSYREDIRKFLFRGVNKILQHPYSKFISGHIKELRDFLNNHKRFYLSADKLKTECPSTGNDKGLDLLLQTPSHSLSGLSHWLLEILQTIGINYHDATKGEGKEEQVKSDPLFQESLFRMYTLINRLCNLIDQEDLDIDIHTYQRLMTQLINSTTIPFHGEPAVGIQIMGILETRNLDFDHVLLLSCNEGNIPKGVNDTSFIPYSIRKAYGLTTVDHKVAIYSYYFYRLLQRAKDVTLVYDNATNNGQTGEMSRFMLQLMVESPQSIRTENLTAGQKPVIRTRSSIEKDEQVMQVIRQMHRLSPTALNTYIRCPLQFYYKYIAKIKEPDEIDEDRVDNRTFGNIFHLACQLFYLHLAAPGDTRTEKTPQGEQTTDIIRPIMIREDELKNALRNPAIIEQCVDNAFRQDLFKVGPHTPVKYNGLQIINRQVVIDYIRKLLEIDLKSTPFQILGLEKRVEASISFPTRQERRTMTIFGNIDRLDQVNIPAEGPTLRVIDYKTGNNNKMAVRDLGDIFSGKKLANHTDYYLQAMLYAGIVRNERNDEGEKRYDVNDLPVSPSLLFIQHSGEEIVPLRIGKEPITDIKKYENEKGDKNTDNFEENIRGILSDIFNPEIALTATEDAKQCDHCPYSRLCCGKR